VTASVFLYGEDGKLTREEIKKSSRTTTNILFGYSDLIQRVLRRRLPWQRWTDTVSILEAGRGPRCAEILAVIEPP